MMGAYDPTCDMPDYVRWTKAASSDAFGYSDYLHAQVVRGALGADVIGALVGWLWPAFNTINGFVVLVGSEKKCAELQTHQLSPNEIEYWANFTNIDGLLPGISTAFTAHLASTMKDIWQAKLNADFPGVHFVVQVVTVEDQDEVSLTFFRQENPDCTKPAELGSECN